MKKLSEEIGRNFHTDDPSAIPFDYDDNIHPETIATSSGKWQVRINVKSNPELSVPAREFNDELMASHYARQQVQAIKTKLQNELVKEFVRKTIENVL